MGHKWQLSGSPKAMKTTAASFTVSHSLGRKSPKQPPVLRLRARKFFGWERLRPAAAKEDAHLGKVGPAGEDHGAQQVGSCILGRSSPSASQPVAPFGREETCSSEKRGHVLVDKSEFFLGEEAPVASCQHIPAASCTGSASVRSIQRPGWAHLSFLSVYTFPRTRLVCFLNGLQTSR